MNAKPFLQANWVNWLNERCAVTLEQVEICCRLSKALDLWEGRGFP